MLRDRLLVGYILESVYLTTDADYIVSNNQSSVSNDLHIPKPSC
jgi:hypothetical protein